MLQMKGVSKVYRTEMVDTRALHGIDLEVGAGEFVAVTGPSGSGKTTFLNIAGLLEELTGGEYRLDGVDVKHLDDSTRSSRSGWRRGCAITLPSCLAVSNSASRSRARSPAIRSCCSLTSRPATS